MQITELAEQLADVDGVSCVVLGGSPARGTHSESSDYDFGLYYEESISMSGIEDFVRSVTDPSEEATVAAPGEWGPWINGGAWLKVGGFKVDLLCRNIPFVRQKAEEAHRGVFSSHYQVGHPSGYHSFYLLAEIGVSQALSDPTGIFGELKGLADPYPEALRSSIIDKFLWEAHFQLEIVERTDFGAGSCYEMSALSRFISCVLQVLYARSRIWFLNEKRATRNLAKFGTDIEDVAEQLSHISQLPDDTLQVARALLTDVENSSRPS